MTQSQASVAVETTNIEEVQVSSGGDSEAVAEEPQTNESAETPSPTPSTACTGDSNLKKRKRTSEIWLNFKNNDRGKVYCVRCQKHYKAVKAGTTTHLWRHLESCVHYKRHQGKTAGLIPISETQLGVVDEGDRVWVNGKWDPVKDREMLANVIVGHELPFMFSEYSLFRKYMLYNNPLWQKVSRTTITRECMKVVESERDKLKKIFKDVDKVSLTSDCWTSNRTVGFMCITAHYIDSGWNLQKRIITFKDLSPPHSGEVISDAILEAIRKWGIEDKIGTITLDNASNNDKAAGLLRLSFEARDKLHFLGYFFHIRCCAHILNLVVQDGLGKIDKGLNKIREGVKYLKKSQARLVKFGEIATQLVICTNRSLCIDVKTRWNSTYHMLDVAIHYKLAFEGYAQRDSNFEWLPRRDQWEKAEKVRNLLTVFNETTKVFSGSSYPTSNLFLVEIFNVKKAICDAYVSNDEFTREMSLAMYEKFEKYWGEVNVLMAVASILDPRLKMVSVKFVYGILYFRDEVESRIDVVMQKLRALYDLYAKEFMSSSEAAASTAAREAAGPSSSAQPYSGGTNNFWRYLESTWGEEPPVADLDSYLKEPVFQHRSSSPFDVLQWWKTNAVRYPILSKLAKDVLCIPITTVSSESAFSAGGRILDDYRSSLKENVVENLVCGGDWIRANTRAEMQTIEHAAKAEEDLTVKIPIGQLSIN
ncbi:Zinc finger BED domain-containing protein RICESLEEPER 2 [Rhynchospora pubera]|uniref:Zinc finger BED domain-containing protein RICESLEEPER 2 n=1 Tax=Rhynchospora pubera TaxID=906938 RepID=A0AAV8F3I4_9POAL|nr:Zinc finger BED domain-containing protein RICESLEEPER 2 [Rhynchospora pubera]